MVGIKVIVTEESYTSKCSFLDNEPIEKHEYYADRRVKRGLFRAASGRYINAYINGAYNNLRKAVPNAFAEGVLARKQNPCLENSLTGTEHLPRDRNRGE